MIAFYVTKSYMEIYRQHFNTRDVLYDSTNRDHLTLMYECTCLQWRMDKTALESYLRRHDHCFCAILRHTYNNRIGHYICRKGNNTTRSIVAVYEMNSDRQFITMNEAIKEGYIIEHNGFSRNPDFYFRELGKAVEEDKGKFRNGVDQQRIYFHRSMPADHLIKKFQDKYTQDVQEFQIFKYLD